MKIGDPRKGNEIYPTASEESRLSAITRIFLAIVYLAPPGVVLVICHLGLSGILV